MKLSKFERTRLLSARSLQISDNAKPRVKVDKKDTSYEVSLKENEKKKIPLKVVRYTIDGKKEKI